MATLPVTGGDLDLLTFSVEEQSSYTHRLDMDKGRISGTTDGRQAVLQSVYLTLNVERYAYPIYSHNYGTELADLIGQPADYVMSEVKRRIAEALEQDDRITGVGDWSFETSKNGVYVSFIVHTIYGELEVSKEVTI